MSFKGLFKGCFERYYSLGSVIVVRVDKAFRVFVWRLYGVCESMVFVRVC